MKRQSRRKFRSGYAEPIVLLPPNLQILGALPFTDQDFETLDAWLENSGKDRVTRGI